MGTTLALMATALSVFHVKAVLVQRQAIRQTATSVVDPSETIVTALRLIGRSHRQQAIMPVRHLRLLVVADLSEITQ